MRIAMRCCVTSILALVFLGLQACGPATAKPLAEAAVEVFHTQLNTSDFDGIWNAADDSFHKSNARESYEEYLEAVHRKLGHALKTTTVRWSVGYFNFQTRVILQQETQFEHGSGLETFAYILEGNTVKLTHYDIQSRELVIL